MPLDPHLAGLLAMMNSNPRPLSSMTAPQAREMHRSGIPFFSPPEREPEVASVEVVVVSGVRARLYRPLGEGPRPTVVYLHGGGWVMGDLDTYDHGCRRIARDTDSVVLSVDYRLAPEHPFPAGVQDCVAAVIWAADHLVELGGSDVLGVAGDSAGGSLTAVVVQALRERVSAQFLIYPSTDKGGDYPSRAENGSGLGLDVATSAWFLQMYFGDAAVDVTDPRVSPLHGDLVGLPPALIVTAEFDPLRDEGEAYGSALAAVGVPVETIREDGMIHGYFEFGAISPTADAKIAAALEKFAVLLRC